MDDHDRLHVEDSETERPGYFDMLESALEGLLIDRQLILPGEIRSQIDVLDSRTPALGAKVVARAWTDPAFRACLLADGRTACQEPGITFYYDTGLIVLENTATVHNLVVCTLCSGYPRPVLGLPSDWYKLKPYPARAVVAPRALLAEFGTVVPDDVEIHVTDSTLALRFLVLPLRPTGTDDHTEEELAALVTRDAMIGVASVSAVGGGSVA